MGYQESILVCNSKKNFSKLCKALNTAKSELDDYVSVCAIGKLKSSLRIEDDFFPEENFDIPAGSYFVWWAGERHPFQSGCNMDRDEMKVFMPVTPNWYCVFCEYIANMDELLDGIDLNSKKGVCQENNTVRLFELPNDNSIKDEYIKGIG